MNLVFISDTLAPNRNEDADLLPYNSYYSEVFFEYTRLNNDWIRDKLWDDVNITEELPKTEKYVIVWDTFDSVATMKNLVNRESTVSNKIEFPSAGATIVTSVKSSNETETVEAT